MKGDFFLEKNKIHIYRKWSTNLIYLGNIGFSKK